MKLVIASNNKHKITEIKAILGKYYDEILSMSEAGCDDDIVEDGNSFIENALIKARYIRDKLNVDTIADDSGLEVFTLNGKPGIYSARFCGHHGDDDANNAKLLHEMKDIIDEDRSAQYVCAIALCRVDQIEVTAKGTCPGKIIKEYVGDGGFGYDPIFYMEAYQMTMAQMNIEDKNKISHRYLALKGLKSIIDSQDK